MALSGDANATTATLGTLTLKQQMLENYQLLLEQLHSVVMQMQQQLHLSTCTSETTNVEKLPVASGNKLALSGDANATTATLGTLTSETTNVGKLSVASGNKLHSVVMQITTATLGTLTSETTNVGKLSVASGNKLALMVML